MSTLIDVLTHLRRLAPEEEALDDDPVGLLISSDLQATVQKIGVCLDATPEAASLAVSLGVELLVAHHPLIYHPIKRIDPVGDPISAAVVTLVKSGTALYAMHTNWDRAHGGINDTLARRISLVDIAPLGSSGAQALPRLGNLPEPLTSAAFLELISSSLDCRGTSTLRFNRPAGEIKVARVAVCGGAGAFLASDVLAAGADAYVTSDVRHHEFLDAAARGLFLIDAGHDATETPGMQELIPILQEEIGDVEVVWVGGPSLPR